MIRVLPTSPGLTTRRRSTSIVGDGDDRPRLEALTLECGVQEKVAFAGPVVGRRTARLLPAGGVLVMPSTGKASASFFSRRWRPAFRVIGGTEDGSLDPLSDGALGTAVDPEYEAELPLTRSVLH